MNSIPPPVSLRKVFHHRHPPNCVPSGDAIRPFVEWVILMLEGRAWVRDGEAWREVSAGDLIWSAPGDLHIGRADPENLFRCLAVEFEVSRPEGMGIRRFSKWTDIEEIEQLTAECTRMMWSEQFDRNALRDYLYFRLLYQVRLYEMMPKTVDYPRSVAAVVARIEREYAKPLRMEDLAKEAGSSISHLHSEFRKYVKSSPHQALIQKRLQVARGLLLSSNAPIKQIAYECGYFDLPAFVHAFKAHTGETPGKFRSHQLHFYDQSSADAP